MSLPDDDPVYTLKKVMEELEYTSYCTNDPRDGRREGSGQASAPKTFPLSLPDDDPVYTLKKVMEELEYTSKRKNTNLL